MSRDRVAVTPIRTVKSTRSQSTFSTISVELDSHADTCLVGSNVLVVHDHERFVDVYGFDKETRHANASTVNAAIAYEDPVTHSTVILMINQAIKIDSMHNILICPMQCRVCMAPLSMSAPSSCLLHPLRMIMPYGCMTLMAVAHPSPFRCLLMALPVTSRLDVLA